MTIPVIKSSDSKSMSFFSEVDVENDCCNVISHIVEDQLVLAIYYPHDMDLEKLYNVKKSNDLLNKLDKFVFVEYEEPKEKKSTEKVIWFLNILLNN